MRRLSPIGSQPDTRPTFTCESKNSAFVDPMMMSVSDRKCSPPPQQMPLIAVMIGFWISSMIRATGSQMWPIGRVLDSLTSTPEQKYFSPAPVTTATQESSSSRKSFQIAVISLHICTLNALAALSRLSVM